MTILSNIFRCVSKVTIIYSALFLAIGNASALRPLAAADSANLVFKYNRSFTKQEALECWLCCLNALKSRAGNDNAVLQEVKAQAPQDPKIQKAILKSAPYGFMHEIFAKYKVGELTLDKIPAKFRPTDDFPPEINRQLKKVQDQDIVTLFQGILSTYGPVTISTLHRTFNGDIKHVVALIDIVQDAGTLSPVIFNSELAAPVVLNPQEFTEQVYDLWFEDWNADERLYVKYEFDDGAHAKKIRADLPKDGLHTGIYYDAEFRG